MSDVDTSEKIHPPTPRRRQKAKEQGRAPRSNEVVSAGLLLATSLLLSSVGPRIGNLMMKGLRETLQPPSSLSIDLSAASRQIAGVALSAGMMVLPMLVLMMICGVGLNVIQSGLRMTPSKLAPDLQRMAPANRLTSLLSAASLGRFVITVIKLVAITAVSISLVRSSLPELVGLVQAPLPGIASATFGLLMRCCLWTGATLLAFSSVDYALCWWRHEKELMMTEQELRDEMRDAERARQTPLAARSESVQQVIA